MVDGFTFVSLVQQNENFLLVDKKNYNENQKIDLDKKNEKKKIENEKLIKFEEEKKKIEDEKKKIEVEKKKIEEEQKKQEKKKKKFEKEKKKFEEEKKKIEKKKIVNENTLKDIKNDFKLKTKEQYLEEGDKLENSGKHSEAIECYNQALKIDPNDKLVLKKKGNSLYNSGKHSEAIECYNQAIKIDPNYCDAINNKGNILDNLGKYSEAIVRKKKIRKNQCSNSVKSEKIRKI
jgi:tetratricopeptide (TPR) repeat protein